MATLTLTRVFVNRLDTGDAFGAQSAPDRPQVWSEGGEVRTYAGGRQRGISEAGERGSVTMTLVALTKANVDTLRSWKRIPVLVRDHRGQSWPSVFYEVEVGEYRDGFYTATMTFYVITEEAAH